MDWKTRVCDDDPNHWLGSALGVDLGAPGLRELSRRLAQPYASEEQRALAVFHHVSLLPFSVSDAEERTVSEKLPRFAEGDAYFKASLMLHLLRLQGLATRTRWVQLNVQPLSQGLWEFVRHTGVPFVYPLAEVWLAGRWLCTDAYVQDPPLLAAVHRELDRCGWSSGFLAHRRGVADWDARQDALQRFCPDDPASLPLRDLGCYHSHADFLARSPMVLTDSSVLTMAYVSQAHVMNACLRALRDGAAPAEQS